MNVEAVRDYCLHKENVEESCPFGPETLVFKVDGKIFVLLPIDDAISLNAKCDPERAIELRESYAAIIPGFHMNKKHWNTILFNDDASDKLIFELIDHSYSLVAKKRKKK